MSVPLVVQLIYIKTWFVPKWDETASRWLSAAVVVAGVVASVEIRIAGRCIVRKRPND
jgi:hypothetical protein